MTDNAPYVFKPLGRRLMVGFFPSVPVLWAALGAGRLLSSLGWFVPAAAIATELFVIWRALRMRLVFDGYGLFIHDFLYSVDLEWREIKEIRVTNPPVGFECLRFVTREGKKYTVTFSFEPGRRGVEMWNEMKKIATRKGVACNVRVPAEPTGWLKRQSEWRQPNGDDDL